MNRVNFSPNKHQVPHQCLLKQQDFHQWAGWGQGQSESISKQTIKTWWDGGQWRLFQSRSVRVSHVTGLTLKGLCLILELTEVSCRDLRLTKRLPINICTAAQTRHCVNLCRNLAAATTQQSYIAHDTGSHPKYTSPENNTSPSHFEWRFSKFFRNFFLASHDTHDKNISAWRT